MTSSHDEIEFLLAEIPMFDHLLNSPDLPNYEWDASSRRSRHGLRSTYIKMADGLGHNWHRQAYVYISGIPVFLPMVRQ